jgi:hypothetical protein
MLKKLICKYLGIRYDEDNKKLQSVDSSSGLIRSSGLEAHPTLNFSIYKADGGIIIETRSRDRNDCLITNLYVCKEEDDLGDKINKIVTIQLLKL